jgi:lipid-binding SYLF domain-containing protein
MKKLYLVCILFLFSTNVFADDVSQSIENYKNSEKVKSFFSKAYGYAIFPTIGKGGMGIGGSYGEGVVFKQGKKFGKTTMTQITIGFQLGGQAFSQVIFFQDKRAFEKFITGDFEFSAQASAVAITQGAQAQTSTTGTSAGAGKKKQKGSYQNGMAIFSYAIGGLMYEAALGGQTFSFEKL